MGTLRMQRGWMLAAACLSLLTLANGRKADPRLASPPARENEPRPGTVQASAPEGDLAMAENSPAGNLEPIADPTTRKEAVERPPRRSVAAARPDFAQPAPTAVALTEADVMAPPPPDEVRVTRIGPVEGPGDPESAGPTASSPGSPRVPKDDHSPLMGGRVPHEQLPPEPGKPIVDEHR